MSDDLSSTPEHVVDTALRRRLAWGLVAGFGLGEISEREGVSRAMLQRVLGQPGMIVLLRVWTTFFQEGDRGDIPVLLAMCKWALAHILKHARERAVGIGVGYGFICAFSLQVALKPTLKALCAHIEGLIDLGPPKKLRGVRAKLVDVLCWVIETAFTQDLIDKFGSEYLWAQDESFQHSVATGRFGDSLAEYEGNANAAAEWEPEKALAEEAAADLAVDALAAAHTSDAPAPSEESELSMPSYDETWMMGPRADRDEQKAGAASPSPFRDRPEPAIRSRRSSDTFPRRVAARRRCASRMTRSRRRDLRYEQGCISPSLPRHGPIVAAA